MGFAKALQGLGAGLQGQGAAWQLAQAKEEQLRLENEENRKTSFSADKDKRLGALAIDGRMVADLLRGNNPDRALQLLDNRIGDIGTLGGDPSETMELRSLVASGDIPKALEELDILEQRSVLNKYIEPRGETKGGSKIGPVSPKDFTVESLAQYAVSGQIGDLERYTPTTVEVGGVRLEKNADGVWKPIIDASGLGEQSAAIANLQADAQSRMDFATDKSQWRKNEPKPCRQSQRQSKSKPLLTIPWSKLRSA